MQTQKTSFKTTITKTNFITFFIVLLNLTSFNTSNNMINFIYEDPSNIRIRYLKLGETCKAIVFGSYIKDFKLDLEKRSNRQTVKYANVNKFALLNLNVEKSEENLKALLSAYEIGFNQHCEKAKKSLENFIKKMPEIVNSENVKDYDSEKATIKGIIRDIKETPLNDCNIEESTGGMPKKNILEATLKLLDEPKIDGIFKYEISKKKKDGQNTERRIKSVEVDIKIEDSKDKGSEYKTYGDKIRTGYSVNTKKIKELINFLEEEKVKKDEPSTPGSGGASGASSAAKPKNEGEEKKWYTKAAFIIPVVLGGVLMLAIGAVVIYKFSIKK